jgi:hypothetical protein
VISYNVFLERERLPTAADWARVMREGGFETQLDPEFEPRAHSGYVPCPDERIGFEYYLEPFDAPTPEIGEEGAKVIGSRNAVVSLRLSGRRLDREAAASAAATLAAMTDGILLDSEIGHFISSAEALSWARGERYQPLAVARRRANRRKARLTPPVILRLLIILFLAAAILWLQR